VRDCIIQIGGQDTADFGIRIGGQAPMGGADVGWTPIIINTLIDSAGVALPGTDGILTGIDVDMHATEDKNYRLMGPSSLLSHNEIRGCRGDGFRIRQSSDFEESSRNNAVVQFVGNFIHDNHAAGIRMDWNEIGTAGYMSMHFKSDMLVGNDQGIVYENFDEDTAGQNCTMINLTIAGNAHEGIVFDGVFNGAGAPAGNVANCIVWGNNGGGEAAQHGGTAGWDPCDADSDMSYSNWMNIGTTNCSAGIDGNVEEDPQVVDEMGGDWHLTAASTEMIDAGDNFADISLLDVDKQDRTIDGDDDESATVDMGADEYVPES